MSAGLNTLVKQNKSSPAVNPAATVETIPPRVVEELVQARTYAKDASEAFSDAIKAQAAKYKLKPKALSKYVNALEADKVSEVKAEVAELADLLG